MKLEVPKLADYGKIPASSLPPLRPGQERRKVRQLRGEGGEGAIARARELSWWPQVVRAKPVWTGGFWCWTIRTAVVPPERLRRKAG